MGPIGLMGLMGGSEKKAEYWEPGGLRILRTLRNIKNPRGLAAGLIKKGGDGFLMDIMDGTDGMD
jgi:hypothetical protein